MSRITRIQTKQGHPIPSTSIQVGPFPPELYRSYPVVENYNQISGNGGPEIPEGGTAQNGFKPLKWFKCRLCEGYVNERELSDHVCPDETSQYNEEY